SGAFAAAVEWDVPNSGVETCMAVFGGRVGSSVIADTFMFVPSTETFYSVPYTTDTVVPPPSAKGCAVGGDTSMYIYGGYAGYQDNLPQAQSNVYRFNTVSLTWSLVHTAAAEDQPLQNMGCYMDADSTSIYS
ncbi:hypothetical protein KIPB_014988, partial [Kipferlia bialata]